MDFKKEVNRVYLHPCTDAYVEVKPNESLARQLN